MEPSKLCKTSLLSAGGVVRETAEVAGKGVGEARGAYFKVLTQKAVEAALAQGLETQEKLVVWLVLNFVLQPCRDLGCLDPCLRFSGFSARETLTRSGLLTFP